MNCFVLLRILLAIPMILAVLVHIFTNLLNALFMLFLYCFALADILFFITLLWYGFFELKSMSVSITRSSHDSM